MFAASHLSSLDEGRRNSSIVPCRLHSVHENAVPTASEPVRPADVADPADHANVRRNEREPAAAASQHVPSASGARSTETKAEASTTAYGSAAAASAGEPDAACSATEQRPAWNARNEVEKSMIVCSFFFRRFCKCSASKIILKRWQQV